MVKLFPAWNSTIVSTTGGSNYDTYRIGPIRITCTKIGILGDSQVAGVSVR